VAVKQHGNGGFACEKYRWRDLGQLRKPSDGSFKKLIG